MEERFTQRNRGYMRSDGSGAKEERKEFAVELRKSKRNTIANKKRLIRKSNENPSHPSAWAIEDIHSQTFEEKITAICHKLPNSSNFEELTENLGYLSELAIQSKDFLQILDNNNNIEQIFLLLDWNFPANALETMTLILCNFASGQDSYSDKIMKNLEIEKIYSLMTPNYIKILCNVFMIIANICGGSTEYSKKFVEADIIKRIYKIFIDLGKNIDSETIENSSFLLKNIAIAKIDFTYLQLRDLKALAVHLCRYEKKGFYKYAVFALGSIAWKNSQIIQDIIEEKWPSVDNRYPVQNKDFIDFIIEIMFKPKNLSPSARLLSLITSSSDENLEYLLRKNILDVFDNCLEAKKEAAIKDVLLALCNVVTDSRHLSVVFEHPIFIKTLNLLKHPSAKIRLEASFFVRNFLTMASDQEKLRVVKLGLIDLLESSLSDPETEILMNILSSVYKVLQLSHDNEDKLPLDEVLVLFSGLHKLSSHPETEISALVESIYLVFTDKIYDY